MARKFVVRVVREHRDFENPLIECLRYAGHVRVHAESEKVFDIMPPKGVDTEGWATNLAGKMSSYGYNAVVAPAWGDGPDTEVAFEGITKQGVKRVKRAIEKASEKYGTSALEVSDVLEIIDEGVGQ